MESIEEPDRPPSLDLTDLGEGWWRGQLRPAQDAGSLRRLVWSGGGAVFLLVAGITLPHPVLMAAAYVGGFLLLIVTAWSLMGAVNLPLTLELSPTHFTIGDDRYSAAEIDRVDATGGPVKLVVVAKDGERKVWVVSEENHNLDDIVWLAEQIELLAGSAK